MSEPNPRLDDLLGQVAFPETPEERDAACTAIYKFVDDAKAEAWDEGRESLAADFLKPFDPEGFRKSTGNPYRTNK